MGATLKIKDLSLHYPNQEEPALHSFSLTIPAGEILSVVGPSGSGKSSLLRLLSGLARPTAGSIYLDSKCLSEPNNCLPPESRPIGLVSQAGDLFPHLNLAKNIAYGLHKWDKKERQQRVTELLTAIELSGYEKRFPAEISGGEAQRVALARALAPKPQVLLLDEPFSSLDRNLRGRLRTLTKALLKINKTTAIFVTHHDEDALRTGDRVVRLKEGRIDDEQ